MLSKNFAGAVLVAALALLPGDGKAAIDLGPTPNQVFSLWTNINANLLALAKVLSGDTRWGKSLAALTPNKFRSKTPTDVLVHVRRYRAKLDRLRRRDGLAPTKRFDSGHTTITLSIVYVNSGYVLNGQVELLIRRTGPAQQISGFYVSHDIGGKASSDVFGLVDLAHRRLDLILAGTRP